MKNANSFPVCSESAILCNPIVKMSANSGTIPTNCFLTRDTGKKNLNPICFQMISELSVMPKTTGEHFFFDVQPFPGQCQLNLGSSPKTKNKKLLLLEFNDGA